MIETPCYTHEVSIHLLESVTLVTHVTENVLRGSYRGSEEEVSGMVHEQKRQRITRITDIKVSFSLITKISKQDTLFNNPFLH